MGDTIISFPILGDGFKINPPESISLFGFDIYFYGIIIATGFVLAVAYALWKKGEFDLTEDNIIDMLLVTVPLAIVGARSYYVIFNFEIFRADTFWQTFKNIINIRSGGIAIYGAIIFSILSVVAFCRIKKIPLGDMLDIGSMGLLIGQMIGRWGNFINREAFGSETSALWRMGLTYPSGKTIYVHPTFLYESLWNFVGFLILHFYVRKHRKFKGYIFACYTAWYGLGRFWIEWLRVNTDSLLLINTPEFKLPISVCVAAVSFVAAVIYIAVMNKKTTGEAKDE